MLSGEYENELLLPGTVYVQFGASCPFTDLQLEDIEDVKSIHDPHIATDGMIGHWQFPVLH